MTVLLLSAYGPELFKYRGHAVGIGPIASAIGTAKIIASERPRWVVFTGTAGAYRSERAVGEVVVAGRLGWADHGSLAGLAYAPRPPEPEVADVPERLPQHTHVASVLSMPAITTDSSCRDKLAVDWEIEHLEAWSVFQAARAAGVGCAIVLGVANHVGPDAHAEWLRHHGEVERATAEVAWSLCRALSAD